MGSVADPSRSVAVGRNDYLPTLDGWRAIAIGLVLLCHSPQLACEEIRAPSGAYGVDIFFGLSGLLICSRLLMERRVKGVISLRGFYIRRLCRIVPPAALYLAALAVLTALGVLAIAPPELLSCLCFYRNYYWLEGSWYTKHFWSLAVEEHFYILLPALLVTLQSRRATVGVMLLAIVVAGWRAIDTRLRLSSGMFPAHALHRSDLRLDSLFWGSFAALILDRHRDLLMRIMKRWTAWSLIGMVVGSYFLPFPLTWRSILIPWMLMATMLCPNSLLGRLLEIPALRWIGRLSYSLYLWQQLFVVLDPINYSSTEYLRWLQQPPANFVALIVCATLSYYRVERPMMRLGHRLAKPFAPGRV